MYQQKIVAETTSTTNDNNNSNFKIFKTSFLLLRFFFFNFFIDFLCLSHDLIVSLDAGLATGLRLAPCVFFILCFAFRR